MKTIHPTSRFRHYALAMVLCAGSLLTSVSSAQSAQILPLEFQYGGTSSAEVTNQVDAWSGKAGDGWLTKWGSTANGNVSRSAEVVSSNSLTAGKNHLKFTITKNSSAGGTAGGSASRRYDTTDLVKYTVSFQFRLDTPLADLNQIRIFDSTNMELAPATSGASWYVRVFEEKWYVYNGSTAIDTGIKLVQGNIYNLSIELSASSYLVTINNLTDPSKSYTTNPLTPLSFFSNAAVGGYINFNVIPLAIASGNRIGEISLGSISITEAIPEPGQTAFLGMTGLLFAGHQVWRSRRKSS